MKFICLLALGFSIAQTTSAKTAGWPDQKGFIENKGQVTDQYRKPRTDVQFKMQSHGVNLFVGNGQLHYQWNKINPISNDKSVPLSQRMQHVDHKIESYRMDVTLVGANTNAKIIAEDKLDYTETYYKSYASKEGMHASSYKKITYQNIYPNIDWVLYINESGSSPVKYDFVVRPGGNVADIKLQYGGATNLALNANGSLTAQTPAGAITEETPTSFVSQNEGPATRVASSFNLQKNTISFNVAPHSGTLTIDPGIVWATYLGGLGYDFCVSMTSDKAGNVYVGGSSFMSGNIATTGAYQTTPSGDFDGFIAKFNPAGNLTWGTFYGDQGDDNISNIVSDDAGQVYFSGITNSDSAIATPGSFQDTLNTLYFDLMLGKFDSSGNRVWVTYYGGPDVENGGYCALDKQGHVYLTGVTTSSTQIASNGYKNTYAGGLSDAFLVKFDTAGMRQWATYYGDTLEDATQGIACDPQGNVYITGQTKSIVNIATPGAFQTTLGGGYDIFLTKFSPSGALRWSTYYGGTTDDLGGGQAGVACDRLGNVYINARTQSTAGIASANAFQTTLAGGWDAFLAKFDSLGNRKWGTYFGSTGDENGQCVAFDESNNVVWTGLTFSSSGIATPNAYSTTFGGYDDVFLARFDTAGNRQWATYYGNTGADEGYAVTTTTGGNIYVTGATTSGTGIATPNAHDTTYHFLLSVFLAKFCTADIPLADTVHGLDSICANSTNVYSVDSVTDATAYIWSLPSGWTATGNTRTITATAGTNNGVISVKVVKCNDTSAAHVLNVYVRPAEPAIITVNGFQLGTVNTHNTYQWYLNGILIPGATGSTYTVTQNGDYTVKVTNTGGCMDSSAAYTVNNVSVNEVSQLAKAVIVYPNPASDVVHILAPQPVNVTITGIDGKEILHQEKATEINISPLASGLYLLHITDQNNVSVKTEKLTKLK
ncbi:DUF7948 domain-containing protein [Taibaiella soli]|uniref:Uncharacterized protein n=1 Tax=Taibaiella soli TaxID=1649169 RepID=A0A2W2BCR3_9BACT|nr:SBBP repeat-containing protein [Taibaiella soli]PZF74019.1 hypothetical protein DN068_04800 [Taibaiella soli]